MIIETKKICKNYSNCVDKTNNMGYYISCLHEITKKEDKIYKMHEWLSGGVSPCQGEGRGFESRLVLH